MLTNYWEEAASKKEEMIGWRRYLHQHPELGLNLPETSKYIQAQLEKLGISFTASKENSHVVATIGQGDRCVLLRADMDALPMAEESGLDFASTNRCMHACGHDMHATSLLGAAKLLKAHESELKGRVKLLFQAGEEVFKGAVTAMEEGVLEDPKVDVAFAAHMAPAFPIGIVGYGYNPMSAVYGFKIDVTGHGAHGSTPEKGVSPINAAVHIYLALQELIAREISATSEAVITIGHFESGSANNVIPETAVLEGTLRAFDPEVRARLIKRISEVSIKTAEVFGASASVTAVSDCPAMVNDKEFTDEVIAIISGTNPNLKMAPIFHAMGSEDFAFFSDKVPCCYIALGALYGEDYPPYSEHNPKVRFGEDVLVINSAIYSSVAANWLENHAG